MTCLEIKSGLAPPCSSSGLIHDLGGRFFHFHLVRSVT